MTLSELLPEVQELPAADKLKLIRILADALDTGEDVSPLMPFKAYYVPTPYGIVGAGQALLKAIEPAEHEVP